MRRKYLPNEYSVLRCKASLCGHVRLCTFNLFKFPIKRGKKHERATVSPRVCVCVWKISKKLSFGERGFPIRDNMEWGRRDVGNHFDKEFSFNSQRKFRRRDHFAFGSDTMGFYFMFSTARHLFV